MHKLIEAAGRRTAGAAAGLILTGGMVGGVLLAPGAAYADPTPTPTTTATATTTSVSASATGSTIAVTVSVTPSGATGSVAVSGAGGSCSFTVPQSAPCDITASHPGHYTITASFQPSDSATYLSSTGFTRVDVEGLPGNPNPNPNPNPTPTNIPNTTPSGSAPVWSSDSPPLSADGSTYSYGFDATGATGYWLEGAPSWLSIGPDGMMSGDIPAGCNFFSFWVYAQNKWGQVKAGPFTVYCHEQNNHHRNYHHFAEVNLTTSLYCTSPVHIGRSGSCTLWVTNSDRDFFFGPSQYNNDYGQRFASDVTARISLPWQLRAEYCGYFFYNGCHIYGNTAYEDLGNLYPGQTKSLTVHFRVEPGFNIWVYDHGNPFLVLVTGSASSNDGIFNFFGRGFSSSTAYVLIRR